MTAAGKRPDTAPVDREQGVVEWRAQGVLHTLADLIGDLADESECDMRGFVGHPGHTRRVRRMSELRSERFADRAHLRACVVAYVQRDK